MLGTDDRRLYSESFAAPPGHVLDAAVGTTFSLDLESLLFAYVCMASGGRAEPEEALRDPVSVLEALHRLSERVTIFCQAGETNTPRQPQNVYSLLEASIVPASGRNEGAIFHPKLWLLRFRALDAERSLLRAVVLSRNLTTSRAWDSFICLEGEPGSAPAPGSSHLAELLGALPSLALAPLSPERATALAGLRAEVERTSFQAPPPFEGRAHFVATGIGPDFRFHPESEGDRVLAISPFVSPATLRALRALAPKGDLIGRAEELGKCPPDVIAAWSAHTLHENASSDSELAEGEEMGQTADPTPQGLHVKALAVQAGKRTTWWLGSGNLTDPVRSGANVELMLRLEGRTSLVGVDAFLDGGMRELLEPYTHAPPPEDTKEGARTAVDKVKRSLLHDAKLRARCEEKESGWEVLLDGAVAVPEEVSLSARPVSLPRTREVTSGTGTWRFHDVSVEALTSLFAFRIRAGKGESAFELELTLKVPTEGISAEREARITRSIVRDRSAFLRYLECLLSDSDANVFDSGRLAGERPAPTGASRTAAPFAPGLLEQLLRTLHRDPARLGGIRALLDRVEDENGGAPVIPTELRELWSAIEPHVSQVEGPPGVRQIKGGAR